MPSSDLVGKWTYRSFHNDPTFVGDDKQKALDLIFAEAEFKFDALSEMGFSGKIDWKGGGLEITGRMISGSSDMPVAFAMVGTGRPGTYTEGWEYAYNGCMAHHWTNGVGQVQALIGSLVRVKPHDGHPAGYTASFIAVNQKPAPTQ